MAEDLDAERSWNLEAGVRGALTSYLSGELTGFYLNFSNQIIPVSESSGGVGTGLTGLINAGETRHLGVESTIQLNIYWMNVISFRAVRRVFVSDYHGSYRQESTLNFN